jgi:hypothetical protein
MSVARQSEMNNLSNGLNILSLHITGKHGATSNLRNSFSQNLVYVAYFAFALSASIGHATKRSDQYQGGCQDLQHLGPYVRE